MMALFGGLVFGSKAQDSMTLFLFLGDINKRFSIKLGKKDKTVDLFKKKNL